MTSVKPTILIVEDDPAISNFMAVVLKANGYHLVQTGKGRDALSLVASHNPDLVLLDLGLPDMDGLDVMKAILRLKRLPVVIVSARGQEREKVIALDLGADDYVTKPFGTAELMARIRTALRHGQGMESIAVQEGGRLANGDLKIDFIARLVTIAGKEIHLTPIEYRILSVLARNLGKVLTYEAIMKHVWGPYVNELQALRVNMANLRRKIEENPGEPRYITTEVGVGYRMIDLNQDT